MGFLKKLKELTKVISVLKINDVWFSKTIDFLKSVPSIESIEESILKNACIAVKEDKTLRSKLEWAEEYLIKLIIYLILILI